MRLVVAVASTLTLLFAAPAAAAPRATPTRASPAVSSLSEPGFYFDQIAIAGYIGGEFGDGDGVYLRADGAIPVWEPVEKLQLKGVASLGFTHFGEEAGIYDISTNIFKVLASARAQYEVIDALDVYADLGMGLYFYKLTAEGSFMGIDYEYDDSGAGFTMRIAAGAMYEIAPQMKIGAEMGFNPYFGDVDTTEFLIGVGFEYSL